LKGSGTIDLNVDVTKSENSLTCDVSIGKIVLDSQLCLVEKCTAMRNMTENIF